MDAVNHERDQTNGPETDAQAKSDDLALSLNNSPAQELYLDQLKAIAETGDVNIEWPHLQRAIKLRLESILQHFNERNQDSNEDQEPNVEKFDLNNSRDEILELIESFTEAPFTIQRICELLHTPYSHYDRISTFLRGLEKNLRVISSNS